MKRSGGDCFHRTASKNWMVARPAGPGQNERALCYSPSAITGNPKEEAGEEGASSVKQTTTVKDEGGA